jgi:hypothetical protein
MSDLGPLPIHAALWHLQGNTRLTSVLMLCVPPPARSLSRDSPWSSPVDLVAEIISTGFFPFVFGHGLAVIGHVQPKRDAMR